MTLQDDIGRYVQESGNTTFPNRIAAGLQRDYYLVKLTDLPEVIEKGRERFITAGDYGIHKDAKPEEILAKVRGLIAMAIHLQSRESEAATLARRRDELAARFAGGLESYDRLLEGERALIDDLIAAEAEVARLRGERS